MSARPGWHPGNRIAFEPIADMDALDASLTAYLKRPAVNEKTQRKYEKQFEIWNRFCEQRGEKAETAGAETVHALIRAAATGSIRTEPGEEQERRCLSPSTLDVLLAAIREISEQRGITPPHRAPGEAGRRRRLRQGYRRLYAALGGRARTAPAMTRDELRTLCTVLADWDERAVARRALLLLALDLDLPLDLLAGLGQHALTVVDDSTSHLRVGADVRVLACRHDNSTQDDGCLRCAVHEHVDRHPDPSAPWFGTKPAPGRHLQHTRRANRPWIRKRLTEAADRWRHLELVQEGGPGLVFTESSDLAQRAATRDGLVLSCLPEGLWWLRMSAVLLTSFTFGLPLNEALTELDRGDVMGSGMDMTLRLPGLQDGGDARVPPGADPVACPQRVLGRWIALRDAAADASTDGLQPLFCHIRSHGVGLRPGDRLADKGEDLIAEAQRRARMPGHLTGLSPRGGFAVLTAADGRSLVDVQDALRLKKPESAQRHHAVAGEQAMRAARAVVELVAGDVE